MKCLVTGAAGFIGSALVKSLVKEGYEVKALINKTKPEHIEKKVDYVTGDITDIESIKPLVKGVDIVIHCAAHVKDYGPKKPFYKINLEGTKNLVEACEEAVVKKFVFLSHIRYETEKKSGYYSETKALAEQYLMEKYRDDRFPVVIIRPGNVYGPEATIWVVRILESIQKNRITLVDKGKGIFLHTYIDNLLDAILIALKEPKGLGETIDITDDDYTITFGNYFNTLAKMAGKEEIKRSMSRTTAMIVAKMMNALNRLFGIKPWVTPMAVRVLTNKNKVSIQKAKTILGYKPKVDYNQGLKEIEKWLRKENYIS